MKKQWIKSAIRHPGALNKSAKSKGMSVAALCAMHPGGKTGKRCALRKTLMGFH